MVLVISSRFERQSDLKVAFLDVGQGDAAFLRFPNQKTMLIDAGNRSYQWDHGEKTILPFLQSVHALHINYLVGSHAHNDHIGGFISLIDAISIDTLVLSAYPYSSDLYTRLLAIMFGGKQLISGGHDPDRIREDQPVALDETNRVRESLVPLLIRVMQIEPFEKVPVAIDYGNTNRLTIDRGIGVKTYCQVRSAGIVGIEVEGVIVVKNIRVGNVYLVGAT